MCKRTMMEQKIKDLINMLNGLKSDELKAWCNKDNIKKSINGVSNKWVLKENIFKFEVGRNPTPEEERAMI